MSALFDTHGPARGELRCKHGRSVAKPWPSTTDGEKGAFGIGWYANATVESVCCCSDHEGEYASREQAQEACDWYNRTNEYRRELAKQQLDSAIDALVNEHGAQAVRASVRSVVAKHRDEGSNK